MTDYKRVLPALKESELPSRSQLEQLGHAMTVPPEDELLADGCDTDGPRAGYTYVGQFIDHDITEDHSEVPRGDGAIDVPKMTNDASPWLDLHHVYGRTVDFSKGWYDQSTPNEAKLFRLDPTVQGLTLPDLTGGAELDLPRSGSGEPLMPDSRNCENLIIAQLHVLFLRWHNLAIRQIDQIDCPELPPGTRFERARTLVTWQYQHLVRNDYLNKIIESNVLTGIRNHPPKFFDIGSANDVFIPTEFSAAAFRFGHSVVRETYRYNDWQNDAHPGGVVSIGELVDKAHDLKALPHDWLIDWSRFFFGRRHRTQTEPALQINTQLAPSLHAVPIPVVQHFSDVQSEQDKAGGFAGKIDLPARTLLRGRALRLATGQRAAKEFEEKNILGSRHLDLDSKGKLLPSFSELRDFGLADATPLFYYILWEAERTQCGNHLGNVGSRIVVEVIDGLLKQDPNGFIKNTRAKENWSPPKWIFRDGERPIEYFSDVIDLLEAWLPPGHPEIHPPTFTQRLRSLFGRLRVRLRFLFGIIGVYRCWR